MIRFLYLLIILSFCSTAYAQEIQAADERAADRAALREIGTLYEQAINSGNLLPLTPFVAPSASAVFATNEEVRGLEAMQKYFDSVKERLGRDSSYIVKLLPDRTEFFGDIALAHGRSDETARLGSGREYRFTTHWTAVLRKDDSGWKALRLHVSMDPFDNAAVAARLSARAWVIGAGGLLLAVVAFVFGRVSSRQKTARQQ